MKHTQGTLLSMSTKLMQWTLGMIAMAMFGFGFGFGQFAGGDGSTGDPYQIETCTQLQDMQNSLNAHYVLINDVDCSDTANWTNAYGTGFLPIAWGINFIDGGGFRGSLDGSGYSISGLFMQYVESPSTFDGVDFDPDNLHYGPVGLFHYIEGGAISNLTLINPTVVGNYYVGGFVGVSEESQISNVHIVDGYIRALHGMFAGGVVGVGLATTISECTLSGRVRGSGIFVGGIAGELIYSSVSICTSSMDVDGGEAVGGIVGMSYESSFDAVSSDGDVVGGELFLGDAWDSYYGYEDLKMDACIGGIIGLDGGSMFFGEAEVASTLDNVQFSGQLFDYTYANSTTDSMVGCSLFAEDFAGGEGTEEDPYQINTCEQLQAMNDDLSAHYVLIDDVDCSDTINWTNVHGTGFWPIGRGEFVTNVFEGSLDGSGYSIHDIYMVYVDPSGPDSNSIYSNVGVFAILSEGSISNLTLVDPVVVGHYSVGAFVGNAGEGTLLSNVHVVNGYVRALHGSEAGGIVGYAGNITIDTCSVSGKVRGSGIYVGGVVGHAWNISISNCDVSADIDGGDAVGGIIGLVSDGSINNVSFTGTVTGGPLSIDGDVWDDYYEGSEDFNFPKFGCFGGIVGADIFMSFGMDSTTTVSNWNFDGQVVDATGESSTGVLYGCGEVEGEVEDGEGGEGDSTAEYPLCTIEDGITAEYDDGEGTGSYQLLFYEYDVNGNPVFEFDGDEEGFLIFFFDTDLGHWVLSDEWGYIASSANIYGEYHESDWVTWIVSGCEDEKEPEPEQPRRSGGPGPRLEPIVTHPAPEMPRSILNTIEKKTPQDFCGTTDHLVAGHDFGDVSGTRYDDAVGVLVQHCLVDGYNNEGREFGVYNPLQAGEMYKVFALLSMASIEDNDANLGWSYGYKTAGDSIGLWLSINTDRAEYTPVTQTELLQVTFNYMQHMGLINEVPTFSVSNRGITRGEFARFVNVVLGLVSTK